MTPVIVLTTVSATDDVDSIATHLVEKRLAACVNVVPQVRSVYRWQGTIEKDSEQLLLIKTVAERLSDLRTDLLAIHPYEVPEFIVLRPEELSDAYRQWLLSSV